MHSCSYWEILFMLLLLVCNKGTASSRSWNESIKTISYWRDYEAISYANIPNNRFANESINEHCYLIPISHKHEHNKLKMKIIIVKAHSKQK
jgi:hypothetical protein